MNKFCFSLLLLFCNIVAIASEQGPIKNAEYFGIKPENRDDFFKKARKLQDEIKESRNLLAIKLKQPQATENNKQN